MANVEKIIKKGYKNNRLVFISESDSLIAKNGNRKRYGVFKCDCGVKKRILIYSVTSGAQKSCGCLVVEKIKLSNKKRTIHGLTNHDLYKRWQKIKGRCYNKNDKRYPDYGGRGIKMYSKWKSNFTVFYNWAISNGYDPNKEIDRKKNNSGYYPKNCRFVTIKENCNNTRKNIIVVYNNKKYTLTRACELVGLRHKYRTIWQNIKSGKTFKQSIKSYE